MTKEEIKAVVISALKDIAPEVEAETLDADELLRDQVDMDSIDFLNFVILLHEKLKVDIPEVDYGKLSNLNGMIQYLSEKLVFKKSYV